LRVEAWLFDLDGTLLDSAPDLMASTRFALAQQALEPRPDADLRAHVSGGARGLLTAADPGGLDHVRATADLLAHYAANIAVHTRPFPGCEALLDALAARGLRFGIITNKATVLTHALREHSSVLQRAEVLVCGDTLPTRKPDPAPLRHAAERLDVAPEHCVYVGDDARDLRAAQAASMRGVIALWGYLGGTENPLEWPHWRAFESLDAVREAL
jgi:N-acetyl-D-muramate 6-phosphate phosphatase